MGIFDNIFGFDNDPPPTASNDGGSMWSKVTGPMAAVLGPAVPLFKAGAQLAQQGVFGPVPQFAAGAGALLGVTPYVGSSTAKPSCATCGESSSQSIIGSVLDVVTAPAAAVASLLPDLSLVRFGDNVQGGQQKGGSMFSLALVLGAIWLLSNNSKERQ